MDDGNEREMVEAQDEKVAVNGEKYKVGGTMPLAYDRLLVDGVMEGILAVCFLFYCVLFKNTPTTKVTFFSGH